MNKKVLLYWLSAAAVCFVGALALGQYMKATATGAVETASVAEKTPVADKPEAAADLVAQAQSTTTTTTTTTTHGGWTVTCKVAADPTAKTCSAEFRVVNKDNKAVVLIWLLGRNSEGKLFAEFVTPSDILVKPGVTVALNDAKPMKAEYVSCTTQRGCRASLELTPKIARELKAATKAKVGLTLLNGKVMEIGVDIPGIDLALADLGV